MSRGVPPITGADCEWVQSSTPNGGPGPNGPPLVKHMDNRGEWKVTKTGLQKLPSKPLEEPPKKDVDKTEPLVHTGLYL